MFEYRKGAIEHIFESKLGSLCILGSLCNNRPCGNGGPIWGTGPISQNEIWAGSGLKAGDSVCTQVAKYEEPAPRSTVQ